jgi:hypothetical protein
LWTSALVCIVVSITFNLSIEGPYLVGVLVDLVTESITGSVGASTDGCIAVLGDLCSAVSMLLCGMGMSYLTLVGLLGGLGSSTLNGLLDVVNSVMFKVSFLSIDS